MTQKLCVYFGESYLKRRAGHTRQCCSEDRGKVFCLTSADRRSCGCALCSWKGSCAQWIGIAYTASLNKQTTTKTPVKAREKTIEPRISSDNFSTKTLMSLDSCALIRTFRKESLIEMLKHFRDLIGYPSIHQNFPLNLWDDLNCIHRLSPNQRLFHKYDYLMSTSMISGRFLPIKLVEAAPEKCCRYSKIITFFFLAWHSTVFKTITDAYRFLLLLVCLF